MNERALTVVNIPQPLKELIGYVVHEDDIEMWLNNPLSFPGTTPLELLNVDDPVQLEANVTEIVRRFVSSAFGPLKVPARPAIEMLVAEIQTVRAASESSEIK